MQYTKIVPAPEVTIVTTTAHRRPGIIVHRVGELHPLDTWEFDGIPDDLRAPACSWISRRC